MGESLGHLDYGYEFFMLGQNLYTKAESMSSCSSILTTPLDQISEERSALVKEGITYHHSIADELKSGLPFWPIGLATLKSDYLCAGVDCGKKLYLAAWRTGIGGDVNASVRIPLGAYRILRVNQAYPKRLPCDYRYDETHGALELRLLPQTARIFEIVVEERR